MSTYEELVEMTTTPDHVRDCATLIYEATGQYPEDKWSKRRAVLRDIQISYKEIISPPSTPKSLQSFNKWFNNEGDDEYPSYYEAVKVFDLYCEIREGQFSRDQVTDLALSHSLCPVHFLDYAICFDNRTVECEQVRLIHPSHDT